MDRKSRKSVSGPPDRDGTPTRTVSPRQLFVPLVLDCLVSRSGPPSVGQSFSPSNPAIPRDFSPCRLPSRRRRLDRRRPNSPSCVSSDSSLPDRGRGPRTLSSVHPPEQRTSGGRAPAPFRRAPAPFRRALGPLGLPSHAPCPSRGLRDPDRPSPSRGRRRAIRLETRAQGLLDRDGTRRGAKMPTRFSRLCHRPSLRGGEERGGRREGDYGSAVRGGQEVEGRLRHRRHRCCYFLLGASKPLDLVWAGGSCLGSSLRRGRRSVGDRLGGGGWIGTTRSEREGESRARSGHVWEHNRGVSSALVGVGEGGRGLARCRRWLCLLLVFARPCAGSPFNAGLAESARPPAATQSVQEATRSEREKGRGREGRGRGREGAVGRWWALFGLVALSGRERGEEATRSAVPWYRQRVDERRREIKLGASSGR